MPQNRLLIGITGNIGSGKSSFCRFLEGLGQRVISADDIAKAKLDEPEVVKQITELWGHDLFTKGRIDRKKLAAIVFADSDKLATLNSLIHPLVLDEFDQRAGSHPNENLFFDVPLLFEAKLSRSLDYIVLVKASLDVRLRRVIARDHAAEKDVEARIRSQIDDREKEALVDLVINNDGSISHLAEQAIDLLMILESTKPRAKLPFVKQATT